ncbi:hypothetical protein PENSPDRAFT_568187 [Peniophora sp. CONT]|nr:hypothetical protein PENSPDRAFT_568187 [Peniophora sp. CONT]
MQPTNTLSRTFATSRPAHENKDGHSADSYFKDVDSEPPNDTTVHRVDSGSDAVQRPYEHPNGKYAETGAKAAQSYATVDKKDPYDTPENGQTSYGTTETYEKGKGPSVGNSGEGAEGANADGRKPEGR